MEKDDRDIDYLDSLVCWEYRILDLHVGEQQVPASKSA
jgi:hypothetical protein